MRNLFSLILCCLLTTININDSNAQVGINTEKPNKEAALDIQNTIDENNNIIPRGIMIPRMTEAQRNTIDVSNITEINSLMIYNTTEDCYNYYSKLSAEWQSLCGKIGKAEFSLECNSIQVGGIGSYSSSTPLDASHYIKVSVNVTKIGAYNITAMPDPENGYYFTLSGEFLSTGRFTLIIPGAGTPRTPTADQDDLSKGDLIKFELNDIESECTTTIHIVDSTIKPVYTINCGSINVHGICKIGIELDETNYITVSIDGDISGGAGAKAILKTDMVDGMQFASNPVDIIGGTQTIVLYGTGKSSIAGVKTFTISTNSTSSTATCSFTINAVMKAKRLLTIGTPETFQYQFSKPSQTGYGAGAYEFTHDIRNFGTLNTSIIPIERLNVIGLDAIIEPSTLKPYLSGPEKADMIVIALNSGWSLNDNDEVSKLLADYVRNGNPLFIMGDYNTASTITGQQAWTSVIKQIFEGDTTNTLVEDLKNASNTAVGAGSVFRLSSYNHPILNGPFGDARGQYWGEDGSTAQVTINLPSDEIILLSGTNDVSTPNFTPTPNHADGATAFLHIKYPFVFIGDGGFNSHNNIANLSSTICPYTIDAVHFPTPKNNYGRGINKFPVWNSIVFGNIIAWGLNLVEGITPQYKDK